MRFIKSLKDEDRSALITYQGVWGIRERQGEETKQILTCLTTFTRECAQNIDPLFDALAKEDKETCALLSKVNEKCE